MLRTARSLPPKGLSTLGFDPTRFQTEPPACYRASWQLPGPDSHRQATTSLCQIAITSSTSDSGRTPTNCVGDSVGSAVSELDLERQQCFREEPRRRSAPLRPRRPDELLDPAAKRESIFRVPDRTALALDP